MAKKKSSDDAKADFEIVVGTVVGGELKRKGDTVSLGPKESADLLALGRIRRPGYSRRDMRAEE